MKPTLFNGSLIIPLLCIIFSSIMITPAAFAQTNYQNPIDGFGVQIPNGWVIEDTDNTNPTVQNNERSIGTTTLAKLCKAEDSFPGIGGTFQCFQAQFPDRVDIYRYADLHSRPDFAALLSQNKRITSFDLLPLEISIESTAREQMGISNIKVDSAEDRTVNVTDSQTNQTVGTALAKFVGTTYEQTQYDYSWSGKTFDLFVLGNNTNTGYQVHTTGWNATQQTPSLPIRQIFDSFELVE